METDFGLIAINDILGMNFYIPDYQRGYRWIPQQVNDLLNDIWEFANKTSRRSNEKFYCLQPIVVKDKVWEENSVTVIGYEVIDGQQRLTTIFIILKYLAKEFLKTDSLLEDYGREIFTLYYATRDQSRDFLNDMANRSAEADENIDFYYMSLAYNAVKAWFEESGKVKDRTDKDNFLRALLGKKTDDQSTKIIWYKVDQHAESIDLFRRLNIGKIPLTNSELIKALFLNSSSFSDVSADEAIKRKIEISLIWDNIEQAFADEDFWSFCTNEKMEAYPTKIELLFDLIAKKPKDEIDSLYTFLYFSNAISSRERTLWELWLVIEQYFLTLQDWYRDRDLYHKVGYLITIGEHVIRGRADKKTLIEYSLEEKKSKFNDRLDNLIRKSLDFNISELTYERDSDYSKIQKVLLMFNIESIRKSHVTEFYPFKFHKKTDWSIEHIHAQNADLIDKTKKEQWETWLGHHKKTISALINEEENEQKWRELYYDIEQFYEKPMSWETFSQLASEIMAAFSEGGLSDDMHSIDNLALLGHGNNSALSNSVFEVKRRAIIEMDKEGQYIPLCTKRVFLKYYNEGHSTQQIYYWGLEDRKCYLNEIKKVLRPYLPKGESSEV